MDSGHGAQLELQNDLRRALAAGELALHYQPKVDTVGGMVHGVEALLRWTHPVLGPVAPADFIPLAERFGLIVAIGNWVIDEACRQMGEWNDAGLRMRVAINLSTYQLRQGDLVARIQRALERHGVEPAQLTCEIGEAAVMADTRSATQVLAALGAIGLQLAIDDFGSGATRLLSLRRLRVDQLKLARGIVEQIETSADALAVADATVRLGHALGLRVVAVGVETDGQAERLFQLHCDELQGFQFARPMPAARLLAWTRGAKPEGGVDFAPSLQMGLDVPL